MVTSPILNYLVKCIKTIDFEELDSWLALLTEKLTGQIDIADSMDVSLSKLLKMVKAGKPGMLQSMGSPNQTQPSN